MAINLRDLEVGNIYEINPSTIGSSGRAGVDMIYLDPLRNNNIKYINVLNKTPVGSGFSYSIMPLDDQFNNRPLMGRDPTARGQRQIEYGRHILSSYPITVIRKIGITPETKAKIGQTELDKQIAYSTQSLLADKGIPSTKATGPIGSILEMAGIKTPKSKFGGRTRKTKKSKRKTHKRK